MCVGVGAESHAQPGGTGGQDGRIKAAQFPGNWMVQHQLLRGRTASTEVQVGSIADTGPGERRWYPGGSSEWPVLMLLGSWPRYALRVVIHNLVCPKRCSGKLLKLLKSGPVSLLTS